MGVVSVVLCARDWRAMCSRWGGGWGVLNLVLGTAGAERKGWGGRELPWTFTQASLLCGTQNYFTRPTTSSIQGLQQAILPFGFSLLQNGSSEFSQSAHFEGGGVHTLIPQKKGG